MKQELHGDTDLAALDAELLGLNSEERERNEKAFRARRLEQVLSAVRSAEDNLRGLSVELAKWDAAIKGLKKVAAAIDAIPEAVVGQVPGRGVYGSTDVSSDVAESLLAIVKPSIAFAQQRRDRTADSLRKTEERLASAKAEARTL